MRLSDVLTDARKSDKIYAITGKPQCGGERRMIRRAINADLEDIKDLLMQVHQVHYEGRPDIFKDGIRKYRDGEILDLIADDKTPIYVSVAEDGHVAGYAFCVYKETVGDYSLCDRKTLYIDDICVAEKHRREHIGSSLYHYVVDVAKEAGCDSVTLNVWHLNDGAMAFYQHLGMAPLKTTMEQILK